MTRAAKSSLVTVSTAGTLWVLGAAISGGVTAAVFTLAGFLTLLALFFVMAWSDEGSNASYARRRADQTAERVTALDQRVAELETVAGGADEIRARASLGRRDRV